MGPYQLKKHAKAGQSSLIAIDGIFDRFVQVLYRFILNPLNNRLT